jgi:hypothetical protein
MIARSHIESILKANGLPPTAPDDEIRGLLLSARWDNNDVESALLILKGSDTTGSTQVDTMHRVFHTDGHLTPKDISSLLGVDITLTEEQFKADPNKHKKSQLPQILMIGILALAIVFASLGFLMYQSRDGIFHESKTFF